MGKSTFPYPAQSLQKHAVEGGTPSLFSAKPSPVQSGWSRPKWLWSFPSPNPPGKIVAEGGRGESTSEHGGRFLHDLGTLNLPWALGSPRVWFNLKVGCYHATTSHLDLPCLIFWSATHDTQNYHDIVKPLVRAVHGVPSEVEPLLLAFNSLWEKKDRGQCRHFCLIGSKSPS